MKNVESKIIVLPSLCNIKYRIYKVIFNFSKKKKFNRIGQVRIGTCNHTCSRQIGKLKNFKIFHQIHGTKTITIDQLWCINQNEGNLKLCFYVKRINIENDNQFY